MYKSQLNTIIESLQEALADAEKFDAGNDSAGRRLRSKSQAVRNALKTLRNNVQAERNERKAK